MCPRRQLSLQHLGFEWVCVADTEWNIHNIPRSQPRSPQNDDAGIAVIDRQTESSWADKHPISWFYYIYNSNLYWKIVSPLTVLKGTGPLLLGCFVLLHLVTEWGGQPGPGQASEDVVRRTWWILKWEGQVPSPEPASQWAYSTVSAITVYT